MSFGDLFDGGGAAAGMQYPYGAFASSPALSLAMSDAGRHGDRSGGRMGSVSHGGGGNAMDASELANKSLSVSEHIGVVSGGGEDDEDAEAGNPRKRKKRHHRHTPQQIQQLEAVFKEFPHPDEKQRAELSKQLGLEPRQIKFWFQNRRTQMKNQLERHENAVLKQENDKLRAENLSIREVMRDPVCVGCGGPATLGELSLNEHHLRVENARLRDELTRVCALTAKIIGKPIFLMAPLHMHQTRPMPGSSLELVVAGAGSMPSSTMPVSTISEFAGSVSSPIGTVIAPMSMVGIDKSIFLELATSAMDELVKMARMNEPLWIPSVSSPGSSAKETLNFKEYLRTFSPCIGVKPAGFVSEASRESGIVIIDSSAALVEAFMDEGRWSDMFSCMVAKASTVEEISTGVAGSRNGALLLMQAELQVLSPLLPKREVTFLRFCKQLAEGAWAVVDVSIDEFLKKQYQAANVNCRRLPSGCVVQDTPNGWCKVTWVEHAEYDEASVHQLYRPLLRSGLALGAERWLATLQRQCECFAILMSSVAVLEHDSAGVSPEGKRSLLKLAQRMTENFCAGVSASSAREWSELNGLKGSIGEDVRVMVRKSVNEPGVPPGVVLSAATSVWMPVTPERLFNFLRNEGLRAEWDILSNGGPMQEMTRIAKGQLDGNSVTLLRADPTNTNQDSMLILQETCIDKSGAMVVYAPVDIPAMELVMGGGDSTYVALLPSGFAILPGGPSISGGGHKTSGSLLTVAFQILVNSQPTAKLTVESVDTVNNLISCTIKKIKVALHCNV
ncbi:homeobox-leucine zipper protein ROC4-like [Phragmites australis]|uniref:homeobox-leucine zipper protein ROC4-like n=1 Tax=Phragmites australis TaxID=29695 RepID=UPI002D78245E|nr:homeobox-leucine zipper protein ROC4-like [Phragmites australis]